MRKLHPATLTIREQHGAQVQFKSLQEVVLSLTCPGGDLHPDIVDSVLMCLPCFCSARDFVAAMKHSFDTAKGDPDRNELPSSPREFLRQQKVGNDSAY